MISHLSPYDATLLLMETILVAKAGYKGRSIADVHVDRLLREDDEFRAFWRDTWALELETLDRILADAHFLDQDVHSFCDTPAPVVALMTAHGRPRQTVRQWVERRRARAVASLEAIP